MQGATAAFPVVPHAVPFLYANAADKGYYRVNYTPAQVKAITAQVETALSVPERIGFLGDRWALTRAGQGSVGDYLDLVLALRTDGNSQVLDKLLSTLNSVRSRIATPEERKQLKRDHPGAVWTDLYGAWRRPEGLDVRAAAGAGGAVRRTG